MSKHSYQLSKIVALLSKHSQRATWGGWWSSWFAGPLCDGRSAKEQGELMGRGREDGQADRLPPW